MNSLSTLARTAVAVPVLIAIGIPGAAQIYDWRSIDGWNISYYPKSRGCQAFALFEDGTGFFIGFDNNDDLLSLDVTMLDEKWSQIEDGKDYKIELKFGDETPWSLDMDGVRMEGFPGLHMMIDATSAEAELFIKEFQRETSMQWSHEQTTLGLYTLRGSSRAFEEVLICQELHKDPLNAPGDISAAGTDLPAD